MLCTSWVQSYVLTYTRTYVPLLSNALNKNAPMFCHLQRKFDIQTPTVFLVLIQQNCYVYTNIHWHKILAPLGDKLSNRIQWPTAAEAHTFDTIALLSIFLCVEAASKSVSRLVPTDSGRRFWAMKPLPSVRDAHTEHELAKQWKRLLFKRSVTVPCTCTYVPGADFARTVLTRMAPWLCRDCTGYWELLVRTYICIHTYRHTSE